MNENDDKSKEESKIPESKPSIIKEKPETDSDYSPIEQKPEKEPNASPVEETPEPVRKFVCEKCGTISTTLEPICPVCGSMNPNR